MKSLRTIAIRFTQKRPGYRFADGVRTWRASVDEREAFGRNMEDDNMSDDEFAAWNG